MREAETERQRQRGRDREAEGEGEGEAEGEREREKERQRERGRVREGEGEAEGEGERKIKLCCRGWDKLTFWEAPLMRPLSQMALFPVGSSSISSDTSDGSRTFREGGWGRGSEGWREREVSTQLLTNAMLPNLSAAATVL